MALLEVQKILRASADPEKALGAERYFKTGPGQYGEGDKFLGLNVPSVRKIAQSSNQLALAELQILLDSPFHEERLLALMILTIQYKKADCIKQKDIYNFYLANTQRINNWDLVDVSAQYIIGPYLENKDRSLLFRLAQSELLWERRIAIIATLFYIRNNDYQTTLLVAEMLLNDKEDLIHKAVGWMLREVGQRDRPVLEKFLGQYYKRMPRVMLRYAIEHFSAEERYDYLKGLV